jgi:hypothetical protein
VPKTDLTQPQGEPEKTVAKYEDVSFGAFGDTTIKPEDLKTPRIAVLNGQSQPVIDGLARAGEFFNVGTGRSLGSYIQFIPLGFFAGRLYFKDRELRCRSNDRVHGDPGGIDAKGEATTYCGSCVYSHWSRRTPPDCDVAYNYPVLVQTKDGDQPQIAFLSFRGTANDAARQLNGDKVADGKPWYYHIYEASPQQRNNEKGVWWVAKLRRLRETTPEERDYARTSAENLAVQRIDIVDLAGDGEKDEIPS